MKMTSHRRTLVFAAILGCAGLLAPEARAQVNPNWRYAQTIATGTSVPVRTTQTIDASTADGEVFTGIVDQDVLDTSGAVAIPRGSTAELIVRRTGSNEMSLDLDSVTVNGQRYALATDASAVGTSGSVTSGIGTLGANKKTGEYVGGGALLGTVLGAIVGGGKGAAIGAGVGAAAGAGAQVLTQGKSVHVPAETLVTYRLNEDLRLGVADTGFQREGRHYHRGY